LSALPASLVASLKIVGGSLFTERIELLTKYLGVFGSILPITGHKIRKLSYFPDKEKKVRVIAILDYFSQTVLRPLHQYLFGVLRKIPQDCTFRQDSFQDKLPKYGIYYSVDLSAATDRFPMEVICQVLGGRLPPDYISC